MSLLRSSDEPLEAPNSKFEIPNSKQIQMIKKHKMRNKFIKDFGILFAPVSDLGIRNSNLSFLVCFIFRYSDFGFLLEVLINSLLD
jgi:hypothetical protein